MQTTEQNIKLVRDKLSRFKLWPGFPSNKEDLQHRATLLCRLVSNKTLAEILRELGRNPEAIENPSLPLDTNDLDWLLDSIEETMDAFPSQAALRRAYSRYFPPPNERMYLAAAADFAGEVW